MLFRDGGRGIQHTHVARRQRIFARGGRAGLGAWQQQARRPCVPGRAPSHRAQRHPDSRRPPLRAAT